eukprot:scpid56482/ scgid13431/ CUB and sushi domain-containing protein 1; CUB and sushi multiple domains protein 1
MGVIFQVLTVVLLRTGLALSSISTTCVPTTDNVIDYAFHFRCNASDGSYLISGSTWKAKTAASARSTCTSLTYMLPSDSMVTEVCFRDYRELIRSSTGSSVTLWVTSSNSSSVTCFPAQSPCPATATVICHNDLAIVANSTPCAQDRRIAHGTVSYPTGLRFPSLAVYRCNPGYGIKGSNYAECKPDGGWCERARSCTAYTCPPPTLQNGLLVGQGPLYTSTCNPGFELVGQSNVTCLSDSTATALPSCKPHVCNSIQLIPNGNVMTNSYLTNGTAHLKCQSGYYADGSAMTTCISNGSWAPPLGTCKLLTCSEPNVSKSFVLQGNRPYLPGTSLYVNCVAGYTGGGYISCTANATWTHFACLRITCSPLKSPENGVLLMNDNAATTLAVVACKDGYVLSGSAKRILDCLPTGNWSAEIPTCSRKSDTGSVATGGASSSTLAIITGVAGFVAGFLIPAVAYAVMRRKSKTRPNFGVTPAGKETCMDILEMKRDEPFTVMNRNTAYGVPVKEEIIYQDV